MKASVQTDALNNAFKIISRLVPPKSGNVSVKTVKGKQLVLKSIADAATCTVVIPCDELNVKKDILFEVPLDSMRTAVRGRQAVSIEFSDQILRIANGSFKAELNTIEAIEMEALEDESKEKPKKWKLESEQSAWLMKAVKEVALQPNALTGDFMPVSVRLDAKRATVACYDKNHFAFLQSKDVTGDMELTVPVDTLSGILEVFQGANFSIELLPTRITVRSKTVEVALALPEIPEGSLTLDDVLTVSKEATKMKGTEMNVPTETLLNFLDASKAVALKDRAALNGQGDGSKLSLSVKTLSGSVKEKLKIEALSKKVEFNVDFTLFEEALRKLNGDSIAFKVVAKEFLMFNAENLYLLIAMNQEG